MTRMRLVVAVGAAATLATGGATLAATGELSPRGCIDDNETGLDDCAQSTDGLGIAWSVAVSPDGRSVYTVAQEDSAIALMKRNTTTGALTPAGCIDDNDSGLDTCKESTDGLDAASSVAVSPDGRSVYVAAFLDDAIVSFRRNRTTGALTPAGCIDDNDTGADACVPSTNGLEGAFSVAVSADGRSVYVAANSDDAVVRFRRDRTTGALTPAGCIDDNDTGADTCGRSTNGLEGASSVAVSADGRSVYVASGDDDAIVRLRRNRKTGALRPGGCVDDNDTGADACVPSTNGLEGAFSVAVSADGRSVYAASYNDDAIVRLRRNRKTGALRPGGCVDDNDTGADGCGKSTNGLDGPSSVVVSADGRSAYVASDNDDAIVRLRRNPTTGALRPGGCVDDNDTGADTCGTSADGLNGPNSVALSANGRSLYVASWFDDAIARFKREN